MTSKTKGGSGRSQLGKPKPASAVISEGTAKDDALDLSSESPAVDKVGRGHPPTATRWKAGQSGNPKGRPPRSRNYIAEVEKQLAKTMVVSIEGKPTRKTALELAARQFVRAALKGERWALEFVPKLGSFAPEPQKAATAELPIVVDQDFLERAQKRIEWKLATLTAKKTP